VTADHLKLTVYFGERDRVGGRLVSDLLLDALEGHGVRAAVLVRATEGFGIKHRLHTQRMLTLSEDLPLVAVAIDTREMIEQALPTVEELVEGGLVTLERVRMADRTTAAAAMAAVPGEEAKVTLLLGWRDRVEGRPAFRWAVDTLRRHGVAGATVVLGVDGMIHGERRRARFFSRNADVPLTVSAVGAATALTAALGELRDGLDRPLIALERARVCKRDGEAVREPGRMPSSDPEGLGIWQKLTVYASEQARHGRHPLYVELIHRLRLEGAAGATALRGIWGHSGDHAPHGDRFLALRRQVPIVVTVVDRPKEAARWWDMIDELTDEAGLVTSETVPAFRAVGPGISTGGLRLARPGAS
jgi:PII-like signaling protein